MICIIYNCYIDSVRNVWIIKECVFIIIIVLRTMCVIRKELVLVGVRYECSMFEIRNKFRVSIKVTNSIFAY